MRNSHSTNSTHTPSPTSQAAQLELVHEIEQLVRFAPADDVKSAQSALEKSLTTSLLQGPAEPLRHLISVCFCYIFARGARQTLYTTVDAGEFFGPSHERSDPTVV